jgi:hypothetical protein
MNLLVASYYDEILVPVVRGICDRNGWDVCDWLVAHPSRNPEISAEKAFPNATIHRPEFASRGVLTSDANFSDWPAIDQSIINRMAVHEHMFMHL